MFYIAAKALAELVTEEQLETGNVYPPLTSIRSVSRHIAIAVSNEIFDQDVASLARPKDVAAFIDSHVYHAQYAVYKSDTHTYGTPMY